VHSPHAYERIALGGTIGAGRKLHGGEWSCDNLTGLLRLLARDQEAMFALSAGWHV